MISDTLSDAIASIEDYRRGPLGYQEVAREVDAVVAAMRALQTLLDAAPTHLPDFESALAEIRRLLVALPVDDLENAVAAVHRIAAVHRAKGGG